MIEKYINPVADYVIELNEQNTDLGSILCKYSL